MHCYATCSMITPGPQICCHYEMCTVQPQNENSSWKLHSRDINEKGKQYSARNYAKCRKCFQFLCNNIDWTWFFNTLTFARSLGRCWKPRPAASVLNTSQGTWRMLMHEKPCLIPILEQSNQVISIRWYYLQNPLQAVKLLIRMCKRAGWYWPPLPAHTVRIFFFWYFMPNTIIALCIKYFWNY